MNWSTTFYISDKHLMVWKKHEDELKKELKAFWKKQFKEKVLLEEKGSDYNKEIADDKQEKEFK